MEKKLVLVSFIVVLLSASVIAEENNQKVTGKVYFYRGLLMASQMNILFDGQIVGELKTNQYIELDVSVGEQVFFCFQNSAFGNSNYQVDAIMIDVKPNEKYYVALTQNYGYANLVLKNYSIAEKKISKFTKN